MEVLRGSFANLLVLPILGVEVEAWMIAGCFGILTYTEITADGCVAV